MGGRPRAQLTLQSLEFYTVKKPQLTLVEAGVHGNGEPPTRRKAHIADGASRLYRICVSKYIAPQELRYIARISDMSSGRDMPFRRDMSLTRYAPFGA